MKCINLHKDAQASKQKWRKNQTKRYTVHSDSRFKILLTRLRYMDISIRLPRFFTI